MIIADEETVYIDTKERKEEGSFSYIFHQQMYEDSYGTGLQVNDESKRTQLYEMCNKISEALMEYLKEE